MEQQTYTAEELRIPHADLIALRSDDRITLGISEYLAQRISLNRHLAPKRFPARAAMLFWDWSAIGLFLLSIYGSFAYHWWWFIAGFLAMVVIHRSNRGSNTTNIIEAAYFDEDFYNRIADGGGWLYKMSPDTAHSYIR